MDGRLSRRYEFDAMSHMNAVYDENSLLSTYQYNGLGHRTEKFIKNQNVPGGQTELEYVLDFTKRGNNLWDNNIVSALGKYDKKQFLNDELGSTIRTYFSNGKEAGMYGYDEFGEITDKRVRTTQPFGFTGYQWDEYSDTYYAQAREYRPSIGAFISEDVVNDIIGLPETLNHYVYCWGNPCKWIDINGQFTQRDVNQLVIDYYIDEYERVFETCKDDISNTIDSIWKSILTE